MGEDDNQNQGIGQRYLGRALEGNHQKEKINEEENRGVEAAGGENDKVDDKGNKINGKGTAIKK